MIVVAIASCKQKFKNIFIELHVQAENKRNKKIILLNDDVYINCMSEFLTQT